MMRSWLSAPVVLSLSLGLVGCGDDGDDGSGGSGGAGTTTATTTSATTGTTTSTASTTTSTGSSSACMMSVESSYDGSGFATNSAVPMALRSQLGVVNDLMKAAEGNLAVLPTYAQLLAAYEAGSPSLRDVTSPYYDLVLLDTFSAFEAAAGNTWTAVDPPVGSGGKFGAYIFSERGVDLRQEFEKGQFEAVFFNQAQAMAAKGVVSLAELDALLALFGAHPSFPGDSETTDPAVQPNPDRIGAQYAERRSPKDVSDSSLPADSANPGPYFRIKQQFLVAQAAIKAGSDCDAERDAAVSEIVREWEAVMGATVIYYLNDSRTKLTKDNPTETDLAGGLHGYGEVLGFLHGFRGLSPVNRALSDAELSGMLATLGAPVAEPANGHLLLIDPLTNTLPFQSVITDLAAVYGFLPADVESFKTNF